MIRRPDAATIKAKKWEIRRRYARGKPKFVWITRRVRDLEKVLADYFGYPLPNTLDSAELATVMAHHLATIGGDPRPIIADWLQRWAPWLSIAQAHDITTEAIMHPKRWKADRLAWRLKLTDQDRTRLGVTTIGAVDVSKADRAARRAARKYRRLQHRRRQQGMRTRAEYEAAAINRTKPWLAEGISRRTWYRRQQRGTGLLPSISS